MEFSGTFEVEAPIERVWDTLLDPRELTACIPDLQLLEIHDPTHYRAVVKVGISFMKGKFDFDIRVVEQKKPTRAQLRAHGSGRGSAVDVDSTIVLIKTARGTEMRWAAQARLVGKLASVGSRVVQRTADKRVNEFFGCLRHLLAEAGP